MLLWVAAVALTAAAKEPLRGKRYSDLPTVARSYSSASERRAPSAVSSLYFDRGSLSRHPQNARLTILHSRRPRPPFAPAPPYAVQMEPLVQYSQRDPLYHHHQHNKLKAAEPNLNDLPTELPVDDHGDVITARASLPPLDSVPEAGTKQQHKVYIHKVHAHLPPPVYIREPEPIIEIIVKESNETLPPAPTAPTLPTPPPTKEPVQVFYVKYKKESGKYGKESTLVYDPPIPALSSTKSTIEHEEVNPLPTVDAELPPTPRPPTTTLRTIIRPDSETFHGSGLHVTFGGPEEHQHHEHHEEHLQQSAPQPSVVFPHQQHFPGPSAPPIQRQDVSSFANAQFKRQQEQTPLLHPRQSSFPPPPPPPPPGSQSFQRPQFVSQRPPQFQQRPAFSQPPPFRQVPVGASSNLPAFRQQPPPNFQQQQQQRPAFQQTFPFQNAPQRLPFPQSPPQKPSPPFQPNFGEQQRPNFTPHPSQQNFHQLPIQRQQQQQQQQQFPNRQQQQTNFNPNQQGVPFFGNADIVKSISQQLQPTNAQFAQQQLPNNAQFAQQQQPNNAQFAQQHQINNAQLTSQQFEERNRFQQQLHHQQQQFLNRQQNQHHHQQSAAVLPTPSTQTSNNTKSQYSFTLKSPTTTTSTTTPAPVPSTTVAASKEENSVKPSVLAALPDEVPEDLRQQLLSSGILSNADIQVLDYDKVGDIPIESLPPEALENFYGAASAPIAVKVPAPTSNGSVEMKVVHYDPTTAEGLKVPEQYVREDATAVDPVVLSDAKYNRYLPLKIRGAQFPVPDVPELRGRNITSVVVLAPVDYEFQSNVSEEDSERLSRSTPVEVRGVQFVAGDMLKNVVKEPTTENFKRWLQKERDTEADKQSIVLLVAGSEAEKDIFMYDVTTQKISRLRGELSSAFVEVAEANASSEELDSLASASDIMETWLQGPYNPEGDLTVAGSETNTISISSGYSKAADFTGPSP